MFLLFSSTNEIRKLSPSENSLQLVYNEDSPKITGMDISLNKKYLYFSLELMGSIQRISLVDESKASVYGLGQPQKLSVDWVTENVYFVDAKSVTREIKACHIHEQKCAKILEVVTHDQVSSLIVESVNKYMFYSTTSWWLFNSPTSVIYKANLDGSKVHELLKNNLGYVTGLAYDYNKKILYFSDQHLNHIQSIDYDGNYRTTILKNSFVQHPISLSLFEDYIYFLTTNGHMIKCKIFGDIQTCSILKLHTYNTEIFVLAQESKQPSTNNVCEQHNCTYMCVQSEVGGLCICEDGTRIKDGMVCDSKERSASYSIPSSKPVFSTQMDVTQQNSTKHNSVLVGIFVTVFIACLALAVYYYIHRRLKLMGKLNISVRFHNPLYGDTTKTEETLRPGQHEYSNPIHINNQDMQAAANNILQRSKLPTFTRSESNNESDSKLIKF